MSLRYENKIKHAMPKRELLETDHESMLRKQEDKGHFSVESVDDEKGNVLLFQFQFGIEVEREHYLFQDKARNAKRENFRNESSLIKSLATIYFWIVHWMMKIMVEKLLPWQPQVLQLPIIIN